jgi:MFS superfamily sulfate permease-like transporter
MGNSMKTRRLRCKRPRSSDWGADRAVITVVLVAVTIVLLLVGFSGPSVYFVLPGPTGWLYIAAVIIVATCALVWLYCIDDKRNRGNPPGSRTVNQRSKRIPLQ